MSDHADLQSPSDRGSLPAHDPLDPPRRSFIVKFFAAALGALVGAVPFVTGSLFFLDPLLRKRTASADPSTGSGAKDKNGYIRLPIQLDGLPEDGTPQRVTVFDDIVNAWNKFPNQPVGSVWLRKINGQVIAFNTVCPHLGCSIEHRDAEQDFYCPCHTSRFTLDGEKQNEIPPRHMDVLDVRLDGNAIWVKFQNFRAATSQKVPV